MENGVFAHLEQMLHFPLYYQKYSKLNLIFMLIFFNVVLKSENDAQSKNCLWSKGLRPVEMVNSIKPGCIIQILQTNQSFNPEDSLILSPHYSNDPLKLHRSFVIQILN